VSNGVAARIRPEPWSSSPSERQPVAEAPERLERRHCLEDVAERARVNHEGVDGFVSHGALLSPKPLD